MNAEFLEQEEHAFSTKRQNSMYKSKKDQKDSDDEEDIYVDDDGLIDPKKYKVSKSVDSEEELVFSDGFEDDLMGDDKDRAR